MATIDNAKLQITYSHITAPISGRVGLRLVDMGNIVHATDTNGLLVITQLQPIAVLFSLPQDQLPEVMAKMRTGKTACRWRRTTGTIATKIATGKLLTIDNQIDTTTGTYKLKAVFDNAKNELFPNQFVNVHLLVDTKKNVVLVPTTAILRGPQGTYVFARERKNAVSVKTVKVANTTGNLAGISTGLSDGDVVVIDGQDKLKDGIVVDPQHAKDGRRQCRTKFVLAGWFHDQALQPEDRLDESVTAVYSAAGCHHIVDGGSAAWWATWPTCSCRFRRCPRLITPQSR